jgi:hypothetical protein
MTYDEDGDDEQEDHRLDCLDKLSARSCGCSHNRSGDDLAGGFHKFIGGASRWIAWFEIIENRHRGDLIDMADRFRTGLDVGADE